MPLTYSTTRPARRALSAAFGSITRKIGDRASRAPLGLVAITLIALVVVPLTAEWYTRPLFDELRTVATPAQQYLTRVHVALALEGAALRDFAETRNPAFAARYREATARERAARERLGQIVDQLGPLVQRRYAVLSDAARRWHAAADGVLGPADHPATPPAPLRDQLYEDVLSAAARLDEALDAAVHTRRGRIREAGRLQRRTSVALSGLALLALAAVVLVRQRLRMSVAEAQEGRRALERLMESKARLMRGVSHDLKNPLNTIQGYAGLLAEGVGGELSAKQRRSVERIRASAGAVLALVDDLLELARADVGQLHVVCQPVDLRSIVLDTIEEHEAAAQARGHVFEVDIPDDVPVLHTDPARVRQVLGNLLSNAIKYTAEGGGRISVQVEVHSEDGPPGAEAWLAVHVADTGAGIPPSQLEAVFDEFTRLDRSGQGGSGLGLAIARRVARLLGGALTVESEVGRGSRFTLWLPLTRRSGERA